ncbi:MAG TPA: DUF6600 domain-containing protein [Bacteroidia bacterium]|nr:DUF6600 domain-containing protein [Bacteroidia bacterium]
MKKLKGFLASAMVLIFLIGISPIPTKAAPPVSVSFQFFYDNLSPYGAWVSYPSYGYVWIPRASGFRPYFSGGHWVFTDAGWMWASNYDWGWAPFHYGSWLYDPYYGWLWVPGYDWAPAWVTWGHYGGYYGWAPLGPGISFSVGYYPPINYWVFTSPRYMTVNGFSNNYYVYSGNRIALGGNTTITNVKSINVVENTGNFEGKRYSAGPAKADFEKAANAKLNTASIREHNKPGKTDVSGKSVSVYRPGVNDSDRKSAKPSKVTPLENMKRSDAGKASGPDKMKGREPEKKVAPERKNDLREKQPQRKPEMKEQPKERKPKVKEQPKQQERKPEMKQPQEKPKREIQRQPEPKREAAPAQRQPRMERESRPNKDRQPPPAMPRQNQQPQQRQPHEKHNPK